MLEFGFALSNIFLQFLLASMTFDYFARLAAAPAASAAFARLCSCFLVLR